MTRCAAATGIDPRRDPWAPARAVWPLLEVIDDHLGEAWLRTAGTITSAGRRATRRSRARRFGTARHLADLFDRYGVHRPGDDRRAGPPATTSTASACRCPPDLAWQARCGGCCASASVDRARPSGSDRRPPRSATTQRLDLPSRVALFGLTRLAPSVLRVLDAIAAHRDVHLFLLHPSPVLWDRVDERRRRREPTPEPAAGDVGQGRP